MIFGKCIAYAVNDSNDVRKTQTRSTAMYTIYMVQKLSTWYLVYFFNLKCEAGTANTVGTVQNSKSRPQLRQCTRVDQLHLDD
jgi:hypothetical protein